jgi:hypothetical protein
MWNFIKSVIAESIFLLLFYKKWFESEYDLHLILLSKFDLSISNSLSQIHIEKISFHLQDFPIASPLTDN